MFQRCFSAMLVVSCLLMGTVVNAEMVYKEAPMLAEQVKAGTLPPVEEIKHYLSASFYVFANAIAYLQKNAEKNLLQSRHSQQHDPAVGLFMVFLQLFEQARDRLNRFTPRHLDFYYRQLLPVAHGAGRRRQADYR